MHEFISTGPADAACRFILSHGAGAPMTSPFMEQIAALLAKREIAVTRFEFAYMAARREGGKRRPPPKAELLMDAYVDVARQVAASLRPGQRLLIGGKSMGGRVASLVADRLHQDGVAAGLFCLGYPFHPPGRPEQTRTTHLEPLVCPAHIVQGERDPFGTREEVGSYRLSPAISITWVPDGDHDLGPRGASGYTRKGNLELAADALAAFAADLART